MKNFILLICFAVSVVNAAAGNIIQNGDFSQGLKQWFATSKSIKVEADVAGKKAVCLSGDCQLIQQVPLEPDTDYELSYSIMGDNISAGNARNSGACIVFKGGNRYWRSTPAPNDQRLTGLSDQLMAALMEKLAQTEEAEWEDIFEQLKPAGRAQLKADAAGALNASRDFD